MNRKYIITEFQNRITGVLMEEDREVRIEVYGDSPAYCVDEIYVGRVKDVVPNINAAFVDIKPQTTCYMALDEKFTPVFLNRKNTNKVCQGDLILVQVKKEPVKTKAGVVSCGINLTGKYAALTREMCGMVGISHKISDSARCRELKELVMPYVTEEYGYVIRTDAKDAAEENIIEEIKGLIEKYNELIRLATTRTAFSLMYQNESPIIKDILSFKFDESDEVVTDVKAVYEELTGFGISNVRWYEDKLLPLIKLYSIERRIEDALKSHVWLKKGAYLIIEYTEAMTVIDVNTGKFDGTGKDREKTFFKINSEAVTEIARQLRLRNISGIVIVDFINMKDDNNRYEIQKQLERELAKDNVHAAFIDFTKLGLAEITRKKIKKPLYEILGRKNGESVHN